MLPDTPCSTTPANIAHKAQVIPLASFTISQLFCRVVLAVYSSYFPHLHTYTQTHTQSRFQKHSASSVAAGWFPSTGTSCRSPRRGALVQQGSPQLVVRALLIRFSPLPYIILVYISGLCGSLHTNRHFNCILFVFSVLSQPLKLQSLSGTVFVFTYSHKL